jgi:hypothetical protein
VSIVLSALLAAAGADVVGAGAFMIRPGHLNAAAVSLAGVLWLTMTAPDHHHDGLLLLPHLQDEALAKLMQDLDEKINKAKK